jgi:hypothetical protein
LAVIVTKNSSNLFNIYLHTFSCAHLTYAGDTPQLSLAHSIYPPAEKKVEGYTNQQRHPFEVDIDHLTDFASSGHFAEQPQMSRDVPTGE